MKHYIYTKGSRWYIDQHESTENAQRAAKPGYTVQRYTTITQIPDWTAKNIENGSAT